MTEKRGSDGQVGVQVGRAARKKLLKKKREEREKGHCLGPWFGLINEGGKWDKLGWNWA